MSTAREDGEFQTVPASSAANRIRFRWAVVAIAAVVMLAVGGYLITRLLMDRWADHDFGELPREQSYVELAFSSGGSHVAYPHHEEGSKQRLLIDGKPGPQFNLIDSVSFLSPSRVVYRAAHDKKYLIVDGDRTSDEFDEIGDVTYSDDRSHYAVAAHAQTWRIIGDRGVLADGIKEKPSACHRTFKCGH